MSYWQAPDLPTKLQNTFKGVIKQYEAKEFKKASKLVEEILEKFPKHPETLALKGLVVKASKKTDEERAVAYDLVKEGLMHSKMKSPICWNVYGILWRADKNYTQSVKSYLNAAKLQPNNMQIWKDLATLQAQTRDLKGLVETRIKVLDMQSGHPVNWISLAIAHYMNGGYEQANRVLDTLWQTSRSAVDSFGVNEMSEIFIFQAKCLIAMGDWENALKCLELRKPKIIDTLTHLEFKGHVLTHLNKPDAIAVYHELLTLNGDNHDYILCYQHASGFDKSLVSVPSEQIVGLLEMYTKLDAEFPKSLAIQRLALNFATGEEFEKRLIRFITPYLQKTIPSLFTILKGLYQNKDKVDIIGKVFLNVLTELTKSGKLTNDSTTVEAPTTIVWTYKYLAHHYDQLGDSVTALAYIDKAIAHTPTIVELYLTKGTVYKHAGNITLSAESIEKARKLDLADRYLNTKATKYHLKNDQVTKAEETIAMFARQDPEATHASNMFDLQVMWYAIESGNSFYRQGRFGKALRQFTNVDKHFDEIYDDEFDFHSYCLRKMTLKAYLEMIEFHDKIRCQKFYFKAACSAVKTYIALFDAPYVPEIENTEKTWEKKKDVKKPEKKVDPFDADAEKMATIKDPLEVASKFMTELLKTSGDKLDTHLIAIEFFMRKKKFLSVLQAITAIKKLSPNHPTIHKAACLLFATNFENEDSTVKLVMEKAKATFLNERTIESLNAEYLKSATSLDQFVAGTQVALVVHPGEKEKICKDLVDFASTVVGKDRVLIHWTNAFHVLSKNEAASVFNDVFVKAFPLATHFK
jgi:tetratricopeptide (TPR) repeat protein